MKITKHLLTACAGTLLNAGFLSAQILYTTAGFTYTEDFDALNPSFQGGAPHTWTDNTTIGGWYATQTVYYANSNFAESSRMYNMRLASDSTNQSLGAVPGNTSGTIVFGVRLINNTGTALTSFDLSYIGAQWRDTANPIATEILLDWSFNPGALTSGTWNNLPDGSFTALHTDGPTSNLDGTAAENREVVFLTVSEDFLWQPNDELWLRWVFENHGGTNHALSIDDVTFAAIPEPAHTGLAILAAVTALLFWRRKRLQK